MRKTRHTDYIMSVRQKNNLNGQNWQMAQELEEFKVLADNNYGKSQKTKKSSHYHRVSLTCRVVISYDRINCAVKNALNADLTIARHTQHITLAPCHGVAMVRKEREEGVIRLEPRVAERCADIHTHSIHLVRIKTF